MATSDWGVNDPEAVKVWSRKTMYDALKICYASRFMGSDANSICQIRDDLNKGPGDRITTILRMQLTGNGIQGDDTLEGNEEALVTYTDNTLINQLRHAVRSGGKMSEQRVPFSVREEASAALTDWWADRWDKWFFNQLCGAEAITDTRLTGNQAALSPDSSHQIYAGSATAESNLSANASQTFSLEVIDRAVLAARTLSPIIRPLNDTQEPGKHKYVMFITPEQHYDLRRGTSAGDWADIQKYANDRGKENPIFNGALGFYNGVVLHESYRVYTFNSASATDGGGRAVLCGAQALSLAFGRGGSQSRLSWEEEMFDYGNQLGVASGTIAGLKKMRYNSKDYGTLVVSTAHSTAAVAASQRS